MVKNKKPSLGFGDEMEEILENPEVTVEEEIIIEYSRNLLHKNVYGKHDSKLIAIRERANQGKHITVPVFYEEEKLFKQIANNLQDDDGAALSLNAFIRQALIEKAEDILGKREVKKILDNKYDLLSTDPTSHDEREEQRAKRKNQKRSANRSTLGEYSYKKERILK